MSLLFEVMTEIWLILAVFCAIAFCYVLYDDKRKDKNES